MMLSRPTLLLIGCFLGGIIGMIIVIYLEGSTVFRHLPSKAQTTDVRPE